MSVRFPLPLRPPRLAARAMSDRSLPTHVLANIRLRQSTQSQLGHWPKVSVSVNLSSPVVLQQPGYHRLGRLMCSWGFRLRRGIDC